jgi:phenylalanyl-tRNA synthetase beta chain
MKVSTKWLKSMVAVPLDTPDDIRGLTQRLDLTGTAVEGVQASGNTLDGIVIGQILTREPHPNADSLWVTTVDVGGRSLDPSGQAAALQIVCGAQNFAAGDKVPVALVGATLPGGVQIKKAKLRGIESSGMNCSARELGLGDDHAGLYILPADAPVGADLSAWLGSADTIIDLEITPNRPDCMSMLGIAREVGAVYDKPYSLGSAIPCLPDALPRVTADASGGASADDSGGATADASGGALPGGSADALPGGSAEASALSYAEKAVRVSIADPVRCPRYTARVIRSVKIGPSPQWLAERVQAAGVRSINNVVDATNYIMYELGQPLHAFDLDTLCRDEAGRAHIIVRGALEQECFTTLDGVRRDLDTDVTCIVDGNAASGAGATIALAGVMGGLDTEVTERTTDILLESAAFSPAHTSRTSRRLKLFSEAASRYERGVDPFGCDAASARAAALIAEIAGGTVVDGVADAWPLRLTPPILSLRIGRLYDFIGAEIPLLDIIGILTRLGCRMACHDRADGTVPANSICHIMHGSGCVQEKKAKDIRDAVIPVQAPSFRPDLEREIDLYEEVLRIWGMERVAPTLPGGRSRIGSVTAEQQAMRAIDSALRASGLNETLTYAFASPEDMERLGMPQGGHEQAVELVNPMNSDQSVMRRSLLPGLLRCVAYNLSRGVRNVQLYEAGTVFTTSEGRKLPRERGLIAAVLTGSWQDASWNSAAQPLGFFDGKGVVESLARELNIAGLRLRAMDAAAAPWLQPGRAAEIMAGSLSLGWLGEIHPESAARFEIDQPVCAFELDKGALLKAARPAREFQAIGQYPAVTRDIALLVASDVSAERIMQVIASAGGSLLEDARLFDVFADENRVGPGMKSLAFSLSYRSPERTLTSEEVEKLHDKVLRKLKAVTGAELRGN